MCLGIPGEIVAIVDDADDLASVEVSGVRRTISTRLLADEGVRVGDWVLVHVGFAMSKIDEREADLTLDQIRKLGRTYDEELEAFMETEIV
ncbi:MAG: HypC/HybG/HupF family hydrogenase formation chaperone [Microbacterium sp.]|jgi:hydrogenase expression/formation protein HypC|uniref:Hydrogenase isoenzymes formation protein HypC n=1 Tax=Microbacterium ginsengisoli TaxID=400772 RepID=A0A0F0LU67_9MICO|nr:MULTISPECIES: HypC/HybG/HupF family hydrogenase formation chaperone [Microbacterium]MAL06563.1 HypC/HybG/HupF family hydrogenase formation chaperone [Microbacterium sp.]MCK9915463.1 HypC/HybG/HupF family hydrogenase formation chaperone [Microbacteriaceae bacterium K1510]KJL36264.1 Hydrogenase isoenzymes formation protein HypC [Microbacterium ginsengisoli]KQR94090.1 hydrogenase assembly protein HupF [Microbacterium sp. Leaf347]MBN9198251.1 HypC/HybG/HupF family hydrogenase formation chaperon